MQLSLPHIIAAAAFFTLAAAGPKDPTPEKPLGPEDAVPCAYYLSKENRKNIAVITKIETALKGISTDPTTLYQAKSSYLGTFSWVIMIKKKNCHAVYSTIKADLIGWDDLSLQATDPVPPQRAKLLRRVKPDNPVVKNPVVQSSGETVPEVLQLSQPEGVAMKDLPPYYYYDKSAGEGTVLYVIDSGAEMHIPEFSEVNVEKWLWAGPSPATDDRTDGDKEKWHGTGVLSKAVGKTLGVARKATVVVVRKVDAYGKSGTPHGIDALLQTYDDIRKRHPSSKVVVNLSASFVSKNKPWVKKMTTEILQAFVDMKNVLFVMAAGNEGPSIPITNYPQVLGATMPELVVVGGTNLHGANIFQTGPFVKISACATIIAVASGDKIPEYFAIESGTSYAAPFVAGLASNFMGLGDDATTARKRLYENAWPRKAGGPPVAFNGLDYRNHPTLPRRTVRRRAVSKSATPKGAIKKTASPAVGSSIIAMKKAMVDRKIPPKMDNLVPHSPVTCMRGRGGKGVGKC